MTIETPVRRTDTLAGDERTQLVGWLDFHRATLVMKCAGLTEVQLTTAAVPPSQLTLLGLLGHKALVEVRWFDMVLHDADTPLPFTSDDDRDFEFHALKSHARRGARDVQRRLSALARTRGGPQPGQPGQEVTWRRTPRPAPGLAPYDRGVGATTGTPISYAR